MTAIDDPEFHALLAENRKQDIRHVLADWLRDRDESQLADLVLACPDAAAVDTCVTAMRLRLHYGKVMDTLRPSLAEMFKTFAAAVTPVINDLNRIAALMPPPASPRPRRVRRHLT